MRVLLDENVPHDLIPQFPGHDVSTVQELGWAGVKNGDLPVRAGGEIDVFITMDRKLEKQHALSLLFVFRSVWSAAPRSGTVDAADIRGLNTAQTVVRR